MSAIAQFAPVSPVTIEPSASRAASVLLLEDDRLSRRLVEEILGKAGHEVLTADTARGGWEVLRDRVLVDLIVLDSHLNSDWGWEFLADIRRRSYLRDLPVIIYTAHTGREELTRYANLGVQAIHVKPYKARVLFDELKRAMASDRKARLWEEMPRVCERLKISKAEYARQLHAAVDELEADWQIANQKLISAQDPALWGALRRMRTRLPQLGVKLVDQLLREAEDKLREGDVEASANALAVTKGVAAEARRRALKILDIGSGLVAAAPVKAAAKPVAQPVAVEGAGGQGARRAERSGAAKDARDAVSAPFWQFAIVMEQLKSRLAARDEDIRLLMQRAKLSADLAHWTEAIRFLEAAPELGAAEAATALAGVEGFAPAAERILKRMGALRRNGDGIKWDEVVEGVGVPKVAVLTTVARLARVRLPGPLNLQAQRDHTLTRALLAFEIGRLFKLTQVHRLPAAALAFDLGRWAVTLVEPGLAAVVLGFVSQGEPPEAAETVIFGRTFATIGRDLLVAAGMAPLLQDAAIVRSLETAPENPEHELTVAALLLAEELTRATGDGDERRIEALQEALADPAYPTFDYMRARGVELSLDPAGLAKMLVALANSARWVATEAGAEG